MVGTTNRLSVAAYSSEEYEELDSIALLASILQYLYLTVVVLTLLFRKFIGL